MDMGMNRDVRAIQADRHALGLLHSKWDSIGSPIEGTEFSKLFRSFGSSAFRWESFPTYRVDAEDEEFKAYCNGAKESPVTFPDWEETIRTATSAGKSFLVVRVVPNAPEIYFDYEFDWAYKPFKAIGQETRFLRDMAPDSVAKGMLMHDFWLFDNERLVVMNYKPDGEYVGARMVNSRDNKEEVGFCRNFAQWAIRNSITLDNFETQGWQRATRRVQECSSQRVP